jgi:anti-sigma B factor antagonist
MQEKPLEIEQLAGPGETSILRLHGPLLLGNFFQFQSMVRSDSAPVLIIDITGVPYIDSAGIGCLVGAHVSREHAGRKLILCGASERLLNALKVTKVDQLFTFASDLENAQAQAAAR